MDPLVVARYGMLAAERRFDASASRLARAADDGSVDVTSEIVEQIQAKTAFAANASVVRFAQDMWRALLAIQER